jgi:oligoribonuclease NrnB/cAMP/cGMP phosphodiesterase (DHH superfamily)
MAAAAVARFYGGHKVAAMLPGNSDSDKVIQELAPKGDGAGEVWITDLSWTSPETGQHLAALARQGVRIYWIDHHRTAVSRADAPEFKVPFAGKVLSERYSAALLTFNFLKRLAPDALSATRQREFETFQPFAELADDHDRWLHRIPASQDWALAVQTMGGAAAYREILKLKELKMTRRLRVALDHAHDALRRSSELAHVTMVDRALPGGVNLRTACCFGYSSEVAAKLYDGQQRTVVALLDLRSQGVSLRRSPDCDLDLSKLAQAFGGGGHAAASGFAVNDLQRAPAERLSDLLAAEIEKR